MKTRMPIVGWPLFFVALNFFSLTGCGAESAPHSSLERGINANTDGAVNEKKREGREVALEEEFKLAPDEKVSVKGANLTVQLKSVRRTWYVGGKRETADADLIITLDGKEQRGWIKVGEKMEVGGYTIRVSGADPFGKTSATLIVTERKA